LTLQCSACVISTAEKRKKKREKEKKIFFSIISQQVERKEDADGQAGRQALVNARGSEQH
jgi:hypothetical protein